MFDLRICRSAGAGRPVGRIKAKKKCRFLIPSLVLQANLNDFYVSYELNVFTSHPQNMQFIYSALHQNIQDRFNEAGIEINSPHYFSLRDGNQVAIPEQFQPKGHQAPPAPVL